jgi:hypothetical protein
MILSPKQDPSLQETNIAGTLVLIHNKKGTKQVSCFLSKQIINNSSCSSSSTQQLSIP